MGTRASLDSGYLSDGKENQSASSRRTSACLNDHWAENDTKVHTLRRVNARRLIRKTIRNIESGHSGSESNGSASEFESKRSSHAEVKGELEEATGPDPQTLRSLLQRSRQQHQLPNTEDFFYDPLSAQEKDLFTLARSATPIVKNAVIELRKGSHNKKPPRPEFGSRQSTLVDPVDSTTNTVMFGRTSYGNGPPKHSETKHGIIKDERIRCGVRDCVYKLQTPEEQVLHQKRWHGIDPPLTFFLHLFDIQKDSKSLVSPKVLKNAHNSKRASTSQVPTQYVSPFVSYV